MLSAVVLKLSRATVAKCMFRVHVTWDLSPSYLELYSF